MLTADQVHTRRRGDRLIVVPLSVEMRARALDIATFYLEQAKQHQGLPRGEFMESCQAFDIAPGETRLAKGLLKMVLDACEFDEETALDSAALRADLFSRATLARRNETRFDHATLVAECALRHGLSAEALLSALYADLPEAHRLKSAPLPSVEVLVNGYDLAQEQAVLLRATRLTATIFASTPDRYRLLFRTLKFHRLLYAIEPLPRKRGYAVTLDGPMSLFEQTTKYGLQLALALPAIKACDTWSIEADLRWGKDRQPLRFLLSGKGDSRMDDLPLPEEVKGLLDSVRALSTRWTAEATSDLLEAKGHGVCVPDIKFTHPDSGATVYLELLGFWSREAVWKRIEMSTLGLPYPVVFAAGKHLRVSEEALPEETGAALYIYARTLNPRALLDRVESVARHPVPRRNGG